MSRSSLQAAAVTLPDCDFLIGKTAGRNWLNQNHSEERRQKIITGLRSRPGVNDSQIAELMKSTLGEA